MVPGTFLVNVAKSDSYSVPHAQQFSAKCDPYSDMVIYITPMLPQKSDVVAFGDNEVENVVVGEVVESDILTLLYFFC